MKRLIALSAFATWTATALGQDCDCTKYPFRPNPPCFNKCVERLAAKSPEEAASGVKGIDPGVSVGIRVLSENKGKTDVDFAGVKDKPGLEREALRTMNAVGKKIN